MKSIEEKAKEVYEQAIAVNPFYVGNVDPDELMARCIRHVIMKEARHTTESMIK